jgi:hypothetical protein
MNDYVRIGIFLVVIAGLMIFSWQSVNHLAEAKVTEDAEAVVTLQAENDSLKTVISTLTDSTGVSNE